MVLLQKFHFIVFFHRFCFYWMRRFTHSLRFFSIVVIAQTFLFYYYFLLLFMLFDQRTHTLRNKKKNLLLNKNAFVYICLNANWFLYRLIFLLYTLPRASSSFLIYHHLFILPIIYYLLLLSSTQIAHTHGIITIFAASSPSLSFF